MKKRFLYNACFFLFLTLYFVSCTSNNSPSQSKSVRHFADTLENGLSIVNTIDSPFHYKDQVKSETLSGGYWIHYAEDDSNIYLFLKDTHKNKLHLLNKTSNATSLRHLGFLDMDYQDYFILEHDNGNGSPFTFELIDKRSGKNVLPGDLSMFGGFDDYIIYTNKLAPCITDTIFLYNIITQKSKLYGFPKEAFKEDSIINPVYIELDSVTLNTFRLDFIDFKKTYTR